MSFRFREHRGGLSEAMETLKTFETQEQLVAHIRTLLSPYGFYFPAEAVEVKPYADWPDTRIGWDKTLIVTVEGYGVIGFTDQNPT